MAYIAYIDLPTNSLVRISRWRALADELGVSLRTYAGELQDLGPLRAFVREAAALILPNECFLHDPEMVTAFHEEVDAGKRLLVQVGPNALGQLNPFLSRYGLEGTRIAVFDQAARNHPRDVEVRRAASPEAFADHPLLDRVDNLVLQQPNAIQYRGSTVPIIKLPVHRMLAVNQATDFPVDWTSPDISCVVMAPWAAQGGVLALSCGFQHDPYTGPTGVQFPGITAADNPQFATNILNWLGGAGTPAFVSLCGGI